MPYKISVETVDDLPSIVDGHVIFSRDTALKTFDSLRRAERARTHAGRTLYLSIALLTNEEGQGRWESGDPEFPYMVDSESYTDGLPVSVCPDCFETVFVGPHGAGEDAAWKHHFDYCEAHQARIAREEADN